MTDELLRRRLEALAAGPMTADWSDTQRRATRLSRMRRLKWGSPLVVIVLLAAVAGPASGLVPRVIDLFARESAPEAQRLLFAELDTGAPPGMAPGVIAQEARGVISREFSDGRQYTLWIAPTRTGGFCIAYRAVGPGCDPRGVPLSYGVSRGGPRTPIIVSGSVAVDQARRVELEYEDGSTTEAELVWVGEPIDAGFFFLEIPDERIAKGHQLRAVVAEDSDGAELARKTLPQGAFEHVPRP